MTQPGDVPPATAELHTPLLDEYAHTPGTRRPQPTLMPGQSVAQRAQVIARQLIVVRHRAEYNDLYRRLTYELTGRSTDGT